MFKNRPMRLFLLFIILLISGCRDDEYEAYWAAYLQEARANIRYSNNFYRSYMAEMEAQTAVLTLRDPGPLLERFREDNGFDRLLSLTRVNRDYLIFFLASTTLDERYRPDRDAMWADLVKHGLFKLPEEVKHTLFMRVIDEDISGLIPLSEYSKRSVSSIGLLDTVVEQCAVSIYKDLLGKLPSELYENKKHWKAYLESDTGLLKEECNTMLSLL